MCKVLISEWFAVLIQYSSSYTIFLNNTFYGIYMFKVFSKIADPYRKEVLCFILKDEKENTIAKKC